MIYKLSKPHIYLCLTSRIKFEPIKDAFFWVSCTDSQKKARENVKQNFSFFFFLPWGLLGRKKNSFESVDKSTHKEQSNEAISMYLCILANVTTVLKRSRWL